VEYHTEKVDLPICQEDMMGSDMFERLSEPVDKSPRGYFQGDTIEGRSRFSRGRRNPD